MKSTAEKNLNTFLILLIFSLIGNSCADFALVWYSVDHVQGAQPLLSTFYIAQAVGIVLIAPVISVYIDQLPRRVGSIGLDVTYALLIAVLILIKIFSTLSVYNIFPIVVFLAATSALHRSAVGLGALKELSKELGISSIVAKYSASVFFTNLIGSAVSGFIYYRFGLNWCLALAILSFAPMPWIYVRIFPAKAVSTFKKEPMTFRRISEGARFIFERRALRYTSICAFFINFASNIFPGLVALSFSKVFPGKENYASYAIAISILFGIGIFKPASRYATRLKLRWIVPITTVLLCIALLVAAIDPNPFWFTIAFALQCGGAALFNVMSGSLRIQLIPAEKLTQVNTAYLAFVFAGQILGSLILIPLMQNSQFGGAMGIFSLFALASVIGFFCLPNGVLADEGR